jgi:ComF family protein
VLLLRWLGDLLSPPRCASCSDALVRGRGVFCPACSASVERYESTGDAVAFGQYGGALARAIQSFKYEDSPYLARPLGALLRDACRRSRLRAEIVVPVPLHPRRLAQRGYNQSALLARHVADELAAPLTTHALARVVDTVPQVALPRESRRANVEGAFRARCTGCFEGRTIVLVDDVSTTGATLRACGHALLEVGATRVTSVVVARTVPSMLGISSSDDRKDPV